MNYTLLLVYGAPLAMIWGWYVGRRQRAERRHVAVREQAVAAGLVEPASLHPVIDTLRCIGCGSCVKACPEQPEHHVLGLIGNKAQLISPSDCIGHGACRSACPVDAITLVFGSARPAATACSRTATCLRSARWRRPTYQPQIRASGAPYTRSSV